MARFLENILRNDTVQRIQSYLPPLNFITVHYSYFVLLCLVTSLIFWGSSDPNRSIAYIDSLFLVVSAMTEAGLNTVNLSQMTAFQQALLWLLILLGSSIFVSVSTVLTRKRVFESRFKQVVKAQKEARRMRRRSQSETRDPPVIQRLAQSRQDGFESRHSRPRDPTADSLLDLAAEKLPDPVKGDGRETSSEPTSMSKPNGRLSGKDFSEVLPTVDTDHISFQPHTYVHSSIGAIQQPHSRILSFAGVGANPITTSYTAPNSSGATMRASRKTTMSSDDGDPSFWQHPHYLTRHTTGRNGQFHSLSREEREHLGGVEYRAITLLAYIVPIYFVLWQLLGCLGLAAYMAHNKADVARMNGINPWWLGAFNAVSAFNNSGMSLLDANMIPFQTSTYALFTMGLLILAGNTAYPLFLRLGLWTMLRLLCLVTDDDKYRDWKDTLKFVLKYPRRVYTNLFPSTPTWWLLFMVICLNCIDWAAFELLNIGNTAVSTIPRHARVLDGLFQALAVRSGGFYVIAIPSLRIGLQVLYVIMMYISAYPVVITMRHSNVYEERSLGIYADDTDDDDETANIGIFSQLKRRMTFSTAPDRGTSFVHQQIRGQLAQDLWWLVLAILAITCVETGNFERDPVTYSVFNVAFEVVSGYGCVGISTGLPNEAYSFSGGWHTASKLILCAVMLRGRHRGLPVALDRAVQLPDESLIHQEEEDWQIRRERSRLNLSGVSQISRTASQDIK